MQVGRRITECGRGVTKLSLASPRGTIALREGFMRGIRQSHLQQCRQGVSTAGKVGSPSPFRSSMGATRTYQQENI